MQVPTQNNIVEQFVHKIMFSISKEMLYNNN